MKRLDQLTEGDLREQLDSMTASDEDSLFEGLDAVSYGIDPIAFLEAKELYDKLDRLEREKTREKRGKPERLRQSY